MPRSFDYTDSTADAICEQISGGKPLKVVCEDLGVPYTTVSRWARNNLNGFGNNLLEAKRAAAGLLADEMLKIADDCPLNAIAVNRAALQIKTRQWLIAKLDPDKVPAPVSTIEEDVVIRPADFLKNWQAKNMVKSS